MKDQILIFGGLGDPGHSVISFYAPLLKRLEEKTDLIAVDTVKERRQERIKELNDKYNLTYKQEMTPGEYFEGLERGEKQAERVKAVFILTPVLYHFEILDRIRDHMKKQNTLFIVEKPSFSLKDSERGFDVVVDEMKKNSNRFYFIDTAMISPSLNAIVDEDKLNEIGKITKVIAIAVDNPVRGDEKISGYTLEKRFEALKERDLLNLDKSGGAGFGFDMGIHAVAALMRLMESLDITEEIRLDEVKLEAISYNKYPFTRDRGGKHIS